MDDAAGSQKEQGLEKGVGNQVKNPGAEGRHPHGQEHVAQLTDGGISKDPLDVILSQSNGSGIKSGHPSHHCHHRHGSRSDHIKEIKPDNHVDSGRHHCCRVNEGANRCGASHSIG